MWRSMLGDDVSSRALLTSQPSRRSTGRHVIIAEKHDFLRRRSCQRRAAALCCTPVADAGCAKTASSCFILASHRCTSSQQQPAAARRLQCIIYGFDFDNGSSSSSPCGPRRAFVLCQRPNGQQHKRLSGSQLLFTNPKPCCSCFFAHMKLHSIMCCLLLHRRSRTTTPFRTTAKQRTRLLHHETNRRAHRTTSRRGRSSSSAL